MENFETTPLTPEVALMEEYDQVQLALLDNPDNLELQQKSAELEEKLNIEKAA